MKVILSRKGFDTANGGCPSPIMPDGTLLSMPIPSNDSLTYADLACQGVPYNELLKYLNPKTEYNHCHLDPDIRKDARPVSPDNWRPAFGQISAAQGQLRNNNVGAGDLFLFFGWFRQTEQLVNGAFRYVRGAPDLHVLFGYLQVDQVVTGAESVSPYAWHPHADGNRRFDKTNAIYLARKTLSFDETKPGSGTFDYSNNRVLTLHERPMGTWKNIPALMPTNLVSDRKNNSGGEGLYYKGIWQEMVLKENDLSIAWAESVICDRQYATPKLPAAIE